MDIYFYVGNVNPLREEKEIREIKNKGILLDGKYFLLQQQLLIRGINSQIYIISGKKKKFI